MTRSKLASNVAARTSLSKPDAATAVSAVFATIADALASEETVTIARFGTFSARDRPAREGRNPRTGATIAIAASRANRLGNNDMKRHEACGAAPGLAAVRAHSNIVAPAGRASEIGHAWAEVKTPAIRIETTAPSPPLRSRHVGTPPRSLASRRSWEAGSTRTLHPGRAQVHARRRLAKHVYRTRRVPVGFEPAEFLHQRTGARAAPVASIEVWLRSANAPNDDRRMRTTVVDQRPSRAWKA